MPLEFRPIRATGIPFVAEPMLIVCELLFDRTSKFEDVEDLWKEIIAFIPKGLGILVI